MDITLEWLNKKLAELQNDRTTAVINLGRVDGALLIVNQMIVAMREESADASNSEEAAKR